MSFESVVRGFRDAETLAIVDTSWSEIGEPQLYESAAYEGAESSGSSNKAIETASSRNTSGSTWISHIAALGNSKGVCWSGSSSSLAINVGSVSCDGSSKFISSGGDIPNSQILG